MTTSQTTFLSKPTGDEQVPADVCAYLRKRNRQQAYNLIVREFKKSGISQAMLARRLGRGADFVSRLLRRPSNLELDTLSDVVFALSGGLPRFGLEYPHAETTVLNFKPIINTSATETAYRPPLSQGNKVA